MKYLDNPHAKSVVDLTAQLWQLIPTNLEMEKAEASKPMTIGSLRSAIPAT